MRLIVAMSGATGAPLGVRLLETLRELPDVETHLILSRWARANIELETPFSVEEVVALADVVHAPADQAASISSGSFRTDGMIVVPCSMKTLAGIRTGYADDLIGRAADVILKERRPLMLVPRETPLNQVHLENMLALSRMGVIIFPPMPAWYNNPTSLDDAIDHLVGRMLDQFGLRAPKVKRWAGLRGRARAAIPPHEAGEETGAAGTDALGDASSGGADDAAVGRADAGADAQSAAGDSPA